MQNPRLETNLQEQPSQTPSSHLSPLQTLLTPSSINHVQRKALYEQKLHQAFNFNQKRVPTFSASFAHLQADPTFTLWYNSATSSLLVLSGHSSGTLQSQRFCWLSAAVTGFIDEKLGKREKGHVAYFNGLVGTSQVEWRERIF